MRSSSYYEALMNSLLSIGFEMAGQWQLEGDALRAVFDIYAEQHNVLYAFVVEGEVMYVGQSRRTLRARMGNYASSSAKDKSTNWRNKERILTLLMSGSSVAIYTLPDNGLMHYGPFHMNLAAALEVSIIQQLQPPWNWKPGKDGKETLVTERDDVVQKSEPIGLAKHDTNTESELASDEKPSSPSQFPLEVFDVKLEPSYWKKGFFNGRKVASPWLGAHGEKIEIFFGEEKIPFFGNVNRKTTGDKTPRVFGGTELRQRFQMLPEGSIVTVEIFSPLSIRIKPKANASPTDHRE
jgi:hypothetical protein